MKQGEIEKLWFSVFEPVPGVGLNISRGVVVFAKLVEAATKEKAANAADVAMLGADRELTKRVLKAIRSMK